MARRLPLQARRWLLLPPALALALDLIALGRAPLWRDEMATWLFASQSWPDLWSATSHVDRVLLPYYALSKLVLDLTPGLLALRLPSVFAGVATVALVTLIGDRLFSRIGGIAAGSWLAVNGAIVYAATNARPGALAMVAVAAATWLLLPLAESGRGSEAPARVRWAGFAAMSAIAAVFQPFAVLALPGQAALLAAAPRAARRPALARLTVAAAPSLAVSCLLLAGAGQGGQVGWVPALSPHRVVWTTSQVAGGAIALTAGITAAAALCWLALRHPRCRRAGWLAAALLAAVPLAVLSLASVVQPLLVSRYAISAPLGLALLVGAAAGALIPTALRWSDRALVALTACLMAGVIAVSAASGLPEALADRRGDDFPALARKLAAEARPGQSVVIYQPTTAGGFAAGVAGYAAGFETGPDGLLDAVLNQFPDGTPAYTWGVVTSRRPLRISKAASGPGSRAVWLVTRVGGAVPRGMAGMRAHGCQNRGSYRVGDALLVRLRCALD